MGYTPPDEVTAAGQAYDQARTSLVAEGKAPTLSAIVATMDSVGASVTTVSQLMR